MGNMFHSSAYNYTVYVMQNAKEGNLSLWHIFSSFNYSKTSQMSHNEKLGFSFHLRMNKAKETWLMLKQDDLSYLHYIMARSPSNKAKRHCITAEKKTLY